MARKTTEVYRIQPALRREIRPLEAEMEEAAQRFQECQTRLRVVLEAIKLVAIPNNGIRDRATYDPDLEAWTVTEEVDNNA